MHHKHCRKLCDKEVRDDQRPFKFHRPPLWKHPKVFVHNQYVGVNQNSLKHHAAHPRHNCEASTLLPTTSTLQLQILIPPSEFTWPT
ncbi:uncharacterized protein LACBIDRAFT_312628 [Laccaria bicolor S238N-H82]|uniref:Predicted protein n=1 Tax=Laccaria bicolor (strain S238N-H82 / ATCC MYA-4686) TaxID=486041 RepID=B0DWI9_LACBS|nr:uncharacterized protein LACBIDRAFT_312628 [Laccaria bicolor S238N-H82]EDR01099.1 predicted protein [Laccaria bicolor S238N-H82]|eukprot:XP_001888318.1 predicted protein [Laccaria bicolor S238N-H82]